MVRVFSFYPMAHFYILGRTVSGKRHKIPIEMGLIIELGLMRDPRQVAGLDRVDRTKDMCKPINYPAASGRGIAPLK